MRVIVLALVAMVLLTSCQDDAPPGAGASGPEQTSGASSPVDPEQTAEEQPPEPVDPCGLLDPVDYEQWLSGDHQALEALLPTSGDVVRCEVRSGGLVALDFGYTLLAASDYYDEQMRDTRKLTFPDDMFERWSGVGDRAFGGVNLSIPVAAAQVGEQTVYVSVRREGVPADDLRQLLEKLVERVSPEMLEHPVVLPALCPAADSRQVRRVVGKVRAARGHDSDNSKMCGYLGRTGNQLTLRAYSVTPAFYDRDLRFAVNEAEAGKVRLTEGPKGVLRVWDDRPDSSAGPSVHAYVQSATWMISAAVGNVDGEPTRVRPAAFEPVADRFIDQRAAELP